jgi:hypothetical protein
LKVLAEGGPQWHYDPYKVLRKWLAVSRAVVHGDGQMDGQTRHGNLLKMIYFLNNNEASTKALYNLNKITVDYRCQWTQRLVMPADTTMINILVLNINPSFTAMIKMPNVRYRETPFKCLCLLMQITFQPWSPTHHTGHLILRTNDTCISNFVLEYTLTDTSADQPRKGQRTQQPRRHDKPRMVCTMLPPLSQLMMMMTTTIKALTTYLQQQHHSLWFAVLSL